MTRFQKDIPWIETDPVQMGLAFMCVINNAIESMPNGGWLTITSSQSSENMAIKISITDTGEGLEKNTSPIDIFQPFFTTKESTEHLGLGLTLAENIVKKHGGHMAFITNPPRETIVNIILPITN